MDEQDALAQRVQEALHGLARGLVRFDVDAVAQGLKDLASAGSPTDVAIVCVAHARALLGERRDRFGRH